MTQLLVLMAITITTQAGTVKKGMITVSIFLRHMSKSCQPKKNRMISMQNCQCLGQGWTELLLLEEGGVFTVSLWHYKSPLISIPRTFQTLATVFRLFPFFSLPTDVCCVSSVSSHCVWKYKIKSIEWMRQARDWTISRQSLKIVTQGISCLISRLLFRQGKYFQHNEA